VADIGGGGLQPAVAILGALVAVQRGGEGRWIDASMTDGAAGWLALAFAARKGGEVVGRGDQRLTGRYACYRVYACKGGGFYSVAALEPKFWTTLCNAVGRSELIDRQYAEGKEGEAVHRAFEELFASRTRSEWEKELADVDACCEPVLDLDEVASHPQIAARRVLQRGHGDAPRLGEHTAVVLSEIGVDSSRYEELQRQGVI
jgi:crotonobetainyl-CoA:carnitine CoA-transferase CaiB-like acyl-CoA transferase